MAHVDGVGDMATLTPQQVPYITLINLRVSEAAFETRV